MVNLVIIGGSDAGISASIRAKEVDPEIEVTVIVADSFPNFSICGLPFHLSGEVRDWNTLAHRSVTEIEKQGIRLLLEHRATRIDASYKTVTVINKREQSTTLEYDKLIIATGAVSDRPILTGFDLPGVVTLRWMDDGLSIKQYMDIHEPASVVILGTGYIGMEMADALTRQGLSVRVIARSGRILKTVDHDIGVIILKELSSNGIRLYDGINVRGIVKQEGRLSILNHEGILIDGDMVLVATGARPESTLAAGCEIETGIKGAIRVNNAMETNISDIYAAGDCVETWHRVLKKYTYLPLGTTAHKQGMVAGENAAGGESVFSGSSGTQVVKIFNLVIARTGLNEGEAKKAGFDPLTSDLKTTDHKAYYPNSSPVLIRITGDRKTHWILGAQILGHYGAEISKRIDIFATALFHEMTVESLNNLDLSYTPPLSSPWDPVQMAAQEWIKKAENISPNN